MAVALRVLAVELDGVRPPDRLHAEDRLFPDPASLAKLNPRRVALVRITSSIRALAPQVGVARLGRCGNADAGMRTALDGVLAAGDVSFAQNTAAGRRLRVEHWGDALGQGSVAGSTAAGVQSGWSEVPGNGATPDAPAATQYRDTLYLFVRGTDNRIYVNTFK